MTYAVFDDPADATFAFYRINNNLLAIDLSTEDFVVMSHPRSIVVDLSKPVVADLVRSIVEQFNGLISEINSAPWVQPPPVEEYDLNNGHIIQMEAATVRRRSFFAAQGSLSPFRDVV